MLKDGWDEVRAMERKEDMERGKEGVTVRHKTRERSRLCGLVEQWHSTHTHAGVRIVRGETVHRRHARWEWL